MSVERRRSMGHREELLYTKKPCFLARNSRCSLLLCCSDRWKHSCVPNLQDRNQKRRWSNFVVVVLILSTAISMSRLQPFGEGWLEEDCYLVKDGVFAASGCLSILGLGALTISANKTKVKKQQQQLEAIITKDQDQTKPEGRKQNHDDHQMNKSETVIYFVEEAPSTADDRI
ncbi:hypothetical protein YC2023_008336 [Brassica napus]